MSQDNTSHEKESSSTPVIIGALIGAAVGATVGATLGQGSKGDTPDGSTGPRSPVDPGGG